MQRLVEIRVWPDHFQQARAGSRPMSEERHHSAEKGQMSSFVRSTEKYKALSVLHHSLTEFITGIGRSVDQHLAEISPSD